MFIKGAIGTLSELSAASLGVFRGGAAVEAKVTRKQLAALRGAGGSCASSRTFTA